MTSGVARSREQMTIVVGTKTDLAYSRDVSFEEAKELALDLNASYVEVSSVLNTNVNSLFTSVLDQLMNNLGL